MSKLAQFFDKLPYCSDAKPWIEQCLADDMTAEHMLASCGRIDWLVWLLWQYTEQNSVLTYWLTNSLLAKLPSYQMRQFDAIGHNLLSPLNRNSPNEFGIDLEIFVKWYGGREKALQLLKEHPIFQELLEELSDD